ncbi:hypothetical protein ACGFW5_14150 [Streptomyces sp. NPDC048416]|uniref:hypothetical protein n=1 Tax=Streptomyces sp. NPDC048416 TaxID=3365546 RepID=UPI0037158ABA
MTPEPREGGQFVSVYDEVVHGNGRTRSVRRPVSPRARTDREPENPENPEAPAASEAAEAPEDTAGLVVRRLCGLALNPAAPEDVLLRLLASGPVEVRKALCRDRRLPAAVVDAAASHPDWRARAAFAANPHVDVAERLRLVDDPDWRVRAHLADGPATPLGGTVDRLPDWAAARMITTYENDCLADYRFPSRFSPEFRASLLTHPEPKIRAYGAATSDWAALFDGERAALLDDPAEVVRAQALSTKGLYDFERDPARVEADLPSHACHYRSHLLLYGALSRSVIASVLTAPARPDERSAIARNPTLPADIVAQLAVHPDAVVRQHIALRADVTLPQIEALGKDPDPSVRLAASQHPALSEKERAAIDYEVSQDGPFRTAVTPAPPRDPGQLRALAHSGHPLLRRRAAMAEHLPPDLVAGLLGDPDLGVRVLLAQHQPGVPPSLLLRCFLTYSGPGRACLLERPGFPTYGLARYANHPDPAVRALAARDPELDARASDRLTRDADTEVREAGARHPNLPLSRLMELLDDKELAHAAAANPALPVAMMRQRAEAR